MILGTCYTFVFVYEMKFVLMVSLIEYFFQAYLTIRLRARDFYRVILDKGAARVNRRP